MLSDQVVTLSAYLDNRYCGFVFSEIDENSLFLNNKQMAGIQIIDECSNWQAVVLISFTLSYVKLRLIINMYSEMILCENVLLITVECINFSSFRSSWNLRFSTFILRLKVSQNSQKGSGVQGAYDRRSRYRWGCLCSKISFPLNIV